MESIRALLLGIDYTSTNARALHRAKKEAQPASYFIVHHFIYPILLNIDNKVKLIITFCRINFGHEEANLAFFIRWKSSFAWISLLVIFLAFLENMKISSFLIEVKVYVKIGTLL